ncbi:MAG: glycosyltransferase family 39 protein [Patescibacteria group bacterium]|nr:glycosyltransferase family 39 protein [Patescibacteria group bacterium]MCL5431698.1 glycosyltransferase family 39 protein [Patescibacteria group bacterium]
MKKIFFLIVIHIVLLSQLQFTAWPENLVWPYLNLHGFEYYQNIFLIYTPLYWKLLSTFYSFTGISVLSLRIFSYAIVIITDLLLWLTAGKKLLPVLIYVPLQILFGGNGAWVDQLLAPLFLAAILATQNKKFLIAGVILGLAFLTKQTAIYFIVIFLLFHRRPTMVLGILPALLVLAWPPLFDSAVKYTLTFHARYPLQIQWPTISQSLITLSVMAPAFFALLLKKQRQLGLLAIGAALGIFTRFEYFHLQPALPLVAMLFTSLPLAFIFYLPMLIIFLRLVITSHNLPVRFMDPATLDIASQIQKVVPAGEKILIINTWDHLYFLTNTLPASDFFVPSTPWTMDYPSNQERILTGLKDRLPRFIVYNPCQQSKGICYQPKYLEAYIAANYRQILELADGTSVFENNPVGAREKIQSKNSQ